MYKSIELPLNKSILNRYLVLSYLYGNLPNLKFDESTPDDVTLLYDILKKNIPEYNNCKNAGTVFRFILAVAALFDKQRIIAGSERMNLRPCKDLVDSLTQLGAKIEYIDEEGFPPVKIISPIPTDSNNYPNTISIKSDVSSQFVSAIMMIAPALKHELNIKLEGNIASLPYIIMTSKVMTALGLTNVINDDIITILPQKENLLLNDFHVERDWSAVAFWVTILSAHEEGRIELKELSTNSIQGDKIVLDYLQYFGINYSEENGSIVLSKSKKTPLSKSRELPKNNPPNHLTISLKDTPDLFPPLAVAFALNNIEVILFGLENLKWKESDRVTAVIENLKKLSYNIEQLSHNNIAIHKSSVDITNIKDNIILNTHDDHRIAMAFAIFEKLNQNIKIDNWECVGKSYPGFKYEWLKCWR